MSALKIFGRRLREARKRANLDQAELGELLGLGRGAISMVETNRNGLTWERAVDAAKVLNVSLDFSAGLVDDPISAEDRFAKSVGHELVDYVPIHREMATAGLRMGNIASLEMGGLPFRRFRLEQLGRDPRNLRVFRVKGDSMSPALGDGGAVMVDYGQRELVDGGIYVFEVDHCLLVKRACSEGAGWRMESDNRDPAYGSIEVAGDTEIWGRVVWASQRLDNDQRGGKR